LSLNRRRITGSISYKPLISDTSVFRVCNKTGGTIKGDMKKNLASVVIAYKMYVKYCNDILRASVINYW